MQNTVQRVDRVSRVMRKSNSVVRLRSPEQGQGQRRQERTLQGTFVADVAYSLYRVYSRAGTRLIDKISIFLTFQKNRLIRLSIIEPEREREIIDYLVDYR